MKRIVTILTILSLSTVVFSQQPDTVKTKSIRQWSLSKDFTEEVELPFDTLFSLFNRYRLADRHSPLNATLGSYGLPFYQLNFFDRITDPDKVRRFRIGIDCAEQVAVIIIAGKRLVSN